MVLVRCIDRYSARAHEALCQTRRSSTNPAPNSASITRNAIESEVYRRTQFRLGKEKNAHRTSRIAAITSPLVMARWVNSISRGVDIAVGITWPPPQSGQFAPQPSPEKETRT